MRAYVGYARLDSLAHVQLLNQLYDKLWLYHNFFQPVMRLSEKQPQEHLIKRIHDNALPPFDRLCQAGVFSPTQNCELKALRDKTNPMTLRQDIHILSDRLYALPTLKAGVMEDVRLTLLDPQAVMAV